MDSSRGALLFLCSILILIKQTATQPSFVYSFCSNENGNYTSKSTYEANLDHVLSSISSNTNIDNGFYPSSYGQDPDKVYAIGFCRGDLKPDVCRSCISDSVVPLIQLCPTQKEAIGWHDYCSLRFSDRSMFGIAESVPNFYTWNTKNVSDIDGYNEALKTLFDNMISEAAASSSFRKFAKTKAVAPDFSTLYAITECTPDLTEQDCRDCLGMIAAVLPQFSQGKAGGKAYTPSCNFRYETYAFFDLTAAAPALNLSKAAAPAPNLSKGKESNKIRTTIIIVVPSTVTVAILVISYYIFLKVRKRKDHLEITSNCFSSDEAVDKITSAESLQFDFGTIRVATDNFSDANKLGKGGFGTVYRGRLSNGQDIAVKRLSRNSGQGDLEFKNEVLLVAKLQHRNLVRLLGFCLEGNERLLVYEFLPNKSLDQHVFDPTKSADLDWERRYKIISGIARGLLYLHEDSRLRIIHRDLKTGNILLDDKMNPKIADFGMARMCAVDQTEGNTNRIVGTYGYMAPEYALFGQFSIKSDVFSFGVLILEIVSGKKITSFGGEGNIEYLLPYAWRNWQEGTASNLIDPLLIRDGRISYELTRCIHIGLLCIQENVADRPNMASVVYMLNSDSIGHDLPAPTQPASFLPSSTVRLGTSQMQLDINRKVTDQYEVSITELYPR
ncbi:Cysteine-rich receptor-like protein kinase 10 [Morella rubra]|uniref:Cysteine-rich receptor-like protein kinase 10 n=1 Tax=Morella rubra TaxID=262757 RepID=A0A6A1UHB8_9ROSI|nr:Cysteine-rich receptor-like protein kinase 10 [Morella rubra]KAB1221252.1 Cysteine-rich receptor-like protein kinase 10 [Morella rubra]